MSIIDKEAFDFIKTLSRNNNREWFNSNKTKYIEEHEKMISFADSLLIELEKHDSIDTLSGKKSLHRIYRDTRFSKDKTPYKSHWGGSFKRSTALLRGGYYFHIEPGNTFIAGGFWGPNSEDLKRIREEININQDELVSIITSKKFTSTFGQLLGDQLKTAPKGYATDNPAIELLRYKQFLVKKEFKDTEVLANDFYKKANETFKGMRPFFDFMSTTLTTNLNGEPTY